MGSFERVVIVGPGLIGGSLGMALRAGGHAGRVVGVGHRQVSLDRAIEMGAVDEGTLDLTGAVADADLVVLATRVGCIVEHARAVLPHMKPGSVLTDVGSVKGSACAAVEEAMASPPHRDVRFVGGHPLAGSEKRGIGAARADLFRGAVCILTPVKATDGDGSGLSRVRPMWEAVGCRVQELVPDVHDRILAEASHLPHAAASCLVNAVSEEGLGLAARGFMDTTRVASGDPGLWVDILMANRAALGTALRRFVAETKGLADALDAGDAETVRNCLERARQRREGRSGGE